MPYNNRKGAIYVRTEYNPTLQRKKARLGGWAGIPANVTPGGSVR
jgi:hypothetical protein